MKRILLLSLGLFSFIDFQAQWNASNVDNSICTTTGTQQDARAVSDTKGGAIITWQDFRNDLTGAVSDIYVQRIDANGQVKWAMNGVNICNDLAHQLNPVIVEDGLGGAIIVWEDDRGTKRNLYAQRVDSTGNILWTANGVPVLLRNSLQKNAKILSDANNGIVAVWQDSTLNAYDIYAQRLNGNGVGMWSTGAIICNAVENQSNPKAQINSSGDVFVTWQDKRTAIDYDIYAQKINLTGSVQWASNGVVICNAIGTQSNPKIDNDNAGGAFISWQDKRNGVDYDVYAQRINTTGTVQWTANGKVVSSATGSQSAVDMCSVGITNGVVIAWKDARNGASNVDVYANMIDLNGNSVWLANGKQVSNALANQINPNITTDGNGGVVIAFQDSSSNTWDIRAQRFDAAGTTLWGAAGIGVGTAAGDQLGGKNIYVGNGQTIFTFYDLRGVDEDVYAFKVDANGLITSLFELQSLISHSAYPNPSNASVFVKYNPAFLSKNATISVIDVLGQEIVNKVVQENPIELKNLEPGTYFYKLKVGSDFATGSFVIQK